MSGGSGGRDGGSGPLRRTTRALLGIPLYHKLVGANALLLLTAVGGAWWVGRGSSGMNGAPLLLGGLVVAVGSALNLALVRTALGPVEEIEETARRVEAGDFEARADPSPVADRDLRRLTEVFNRMLEVVADYRRRQRELTMRTFEREEREQAETARQLRESTAQKLATLLVRLRAARARLPDPPDPDAAEGAPGEREDSLEDSLEDTLQESLELARQTLEDLRRTARGLRRPEIDDLGLARALRAYVNDLTGPEGPRFEIEESSLRGCLDREARFRLYRILQEAVSNAVEHASAETVSVRLAVEAGTAVAEIRDDGVGFRPGPGFGAESGPAPGEDGSDAGLGLVAMRERARDLGGELRVESAAGHGSRVRVELPCGAAADSDAGGNAAPSGET